ncbi:MAG: nuclear transport factor 2 family protein [Gammaproteobacteria bacterium]|nr:nuclear transport factor 2 family protein [Gammaproteobacteria bacterium]
MKTISRITAATVLLAAASTNAQMPSWSDAQKEVWGVVSQSWVDDVAENGKWPADFVHQNYAGIGANAIVPRMRDETIRWSKFGDDSNSIIMYSITPMAIQMAGNTAVAFYTAETVTENTEGERDRDVAIIVETLVRDGRAWKFLAGVNFEPDVSD